MVVRPPVAFFSAIVLATVAIAGTRVYDAGQKPAHHGHEYPGDAHARQVLGLAPDADLDASARTKADNIDQGRAAGIPDRFIKEYRGALGVGIKLHYNPEHNRLETDTQPQTSSLADAQAALDRMKSRSEASLSSERVQANNAAVAMLNAWIRGDHGKVMANMTITCAQTYNMNGPLLAQNFLMGHSITSEQVRIVRGSMTSCTSDHAAYHLIVQRGNQSHENSWVDFDDASLNLIKENGLWKVDSCDTHEILSSH